MSSPLSLAAAALRQARHDLAPIEQVSASYGIHTLDDAYLVAASNTAARIAAGARVVGKKVGLTSRSVQLQLGVDQPDFGMLFDDMEYLDGSAVPMSRLMQPKIEAEVAFVVGRDLTGAAPCYGEFVAVLACALPALEIVDSAIAAWKLTLFDTVADNASCGLYVLGNQPVAIGELSFGVLELELYKNGELESLGSGAACLGHPLRAAYWLARTMVERGEGLRAGELILSGALGPMVNIQAGDHISARMGKLGTVSCQMV